MKQSVDRGYVMSFAIDGISMLPPKYEMINYYLSEHCDIVAGNK